MIIRCPRCQSGEVDPIRTVNEGGCIIDPSFESKRTIRNILAYAAMGAGVGRKIKAIHPLRWVLWSGLRYTAAPARPSGSSFTDSYSHATTASAVVTFFSVACSDV